MLIKTTLSNMKKLRFSFVIAAIAGLSACNNYKAELDATREQNARAQQELHTLEQEDKLVRGDYSNAIETLNAIEDTLRSIASREKTIIRLTQNQEFNGSLSQRQNIMSSILALKNANDQAKENAKKMQYRIKAYQIKNTALKKLIAQAETRIIQKEAELEETKAIIGDMEKAIANIGAQISEKSGELEIAYNNLKDKHNNLSIVNQTLQDKLNELQNQTAFIKEQAKAYIACGTKRQLRKAGILTRLSNKKLVKNYQANVIAKGDLINYFENDRIDCGEEEISHILPVRPETTYEINGNALLFFNNYDCFIGSPKCFWIQN